MLLLTKRNFQFTLIFGFLVRVFICLRFIFVVQYINTSILLLLARNGRTKNTKTLNVAFTFHIWANPTIVEQWNILYSSYYKNFFFFVKGGQY